MSFLYTANLTNLKSYDLNNKFDSCMVTISVGQSVHEGEKFKATLKLISKHFKKCTIGVCDTLQRHTTAILTNLKANELCEVTKHYGDQWIERNIEYCKQYLTMRALIYSPFKLLSF